MQPNNLRRVLETVTTGKYPKTTFSLLNLNWIVDPSDENIFQLYHDERVQFLKSRISIAGISAEQFLDNLPFLIFEEICNHYAFASNTIINDIVDDMSAFIAESYSIALWELYKTCKNVDIITFVDNRPITAQKHWLLLNISRDKKDTHELITNIFEALQPWLDKELYAKIKEDKNDTNDRENIFYDDIEFEQQILDQVKKKDAETPIDLKDKL
jgi:hypothetical protein